MFVRRLAKSPWQPRLQSQTAFREHAKALRALLGATVHSPPRLKTSNS